MSQGPDEDDAAHRGDGIDHGDPVQIKKDLIKSASPADA